ncbi:MAG TPA: type 2 lanthipeptide synthetase LanM [Candidatus Dormibacteraeota bacterium]|nr:type 2 lanthipeptide synthetase LanM [Candidatus Dormibacteraeota bacterium]
MNALNQINTMNTTSGEKNGTVFLNTAASIGARLCRDALWDGARCNWMGDSMEFESNAWTVVHRVFGPELYNGTSGIALFLGQLYRATGEKPFKTAAIGAALQAASRAGGIPEASRAGFYSGQTGIAYVLSELADLFDRDDLLEAAFSLIEGLQPLKLDAHLLDVISGSAGAIPAFLRFYRKYTKEVFLQLAVRHGEHLLKTANQHDEGSSWTTIAMPGQPDLLGFSHGTAGIGWALTELHHSIQDRRYREAARAAFRYERHHFSAQHENWPDLRSLQTVQPGQKAEPSYAVAWCHGAPGIGLSRLRCFQLTGDPELRREAEAAIRTTMKALDPGLYGGQANFSLCHGLGGNAELLLYGAEVLNRKDWAAAAQHLGLQGIQMYEKNRMPWPCGVLGGGETPNLLLGLAGIGHFYLRLHDAAAYPSVLIVTSQTEALAAAA